MDSYIKCHYCHKNLTNPLELVCRHSYCADCLTKEIHNNKIICPICSTEYVATGSSISSAKEDTLAPYLIGLNSGAPYSVITDDSPPTLQAECTGCKKVTDLRTCYHCGKPLCAECRGKHSELQKKEVDQSVHHLATTTDDLIVLAKELNSSRNARIQEYQAMKDRISTHTKDLLQRTQDEEIALQKKIDTRTQIENEKIVVTEREIEHLRKNKAALDDVEDKYRHEKNQMVLLKMRKDFLDTAPVWKQKLETNAGRLNPKNEEELRFQPNNAGKTDILVGVLSDSKNVNVKASSNAKRMAARNDQTKSRACIIM